LVHPYKGILFSTMKDLVIHTKIWVIPHKKLPAERNKTIVLHIFPEMTRYL
jgi:hypothetical protein